MSIRNINSNFNSIRPPQFIKPASQPAMNVIENLPADIQAIQYMYDKYTEKNYIEGYLAKYNDLTVDGSPYGADKWTTWYVELCGPVLTMWDAETPATVNEEGETTPVIPQYINLADANVYISDEQNGVFSLNSAGSNRFLFQPVENAPFQSLLWVSAIRLSCFEWSRIHQIYTKKFTQRYNNEVIAATKPNPKMEGYIQVRLPGETGWQKYWAIVSDRRDEKTLFGKKKVPTQAQLVFYENKKQKQPIFTITNIVNTYTLYPESPQLIDIATILKIEGSSSSGKYDHQQENNNTETSSALIMTSSRNELIQWLVAIFDSFKLYGRPDIFFDDIYNVNALNFGDLNNIDSRLFLELDDIQHINNTQDSFAQNKISFSDILLQKMQGHIPTAPTTSTTEHINQTYHNNHASENMVNSTVPDSDAHRPTMTRSTTNLTDYSSNNANSQENRRTIVPSTSGRGGKLIYASDDSEEEDDNHEDGDDEDESDDDDDVIISKNSTLSLPKLNSMNLNNENKNEDNKKPKLENKEENNQQNRELYEDGDDNSTISDVSETSVKEEKEKKAIPTPARNRQRSARPQASVSGSGTESEEEEEEEEDYSSDDDDKKISDLRQQGSSSQLLLANQQDQYYDQHPEDAMYDPSTGMYYNPAQHEYPQFGVHADIQIDEDGPVIPELGSNFATQNSLLDTYRPDHPNARDQIEYARQTGSTLLHVPEKPPEPSMGLVGMISQIEGEKKSSSKGRLVQREKEKLLERERERYLWEQRQQMLPQMNQPPLMNQMNISQPTLLSQMNSNQMMGMNQMNSNQMMGMNQMGNNQMMGQFGMLQPPMMDPRMSMMDPRMSMMGQMPPMMMGQLPMMDQRASMMPPMMMGQSPMMDQRASMMPPMMMGQSPMMDQRTSMMNMQMMMAMYQNNGLLYNQQLQANRFGSSMTLNDLNEDDDEDDDVPLGGQRNDSAAKTKH
ncbi:unnamed protein product [Cunninghamella echinulata]